MHIILDVLPDSIGKELSLVPGDKLLRINGKEILDIFDYHYYAEEEELLLEIEKKNGEVWEIEVEKEEGEDLGLVFSSGLMDEYRSCKNRCIFCFIDQMPKGMRETLYFKDDDSRLSFLQGNYITLTNLKKEDVERICFYKLSPIHVSIHTTNRDLRCRMLNNRFAGEALSLLSSFKEAGIFLNGQIVLCKGYNDGEELTKTIHDLETFLPNLQSVSVVPVGLTKYRDTLVKLEPFDKEDSKKVLKQIHALQAECYKKHGTRMVYAADEWYLKAGVSIPKAKEYEGYLQIENGVGMIRSFYDEVIDALEQEEGDARRVSCSIATGELAKPILETLLELVKKKFPNIEVPIYAVKNNFFGEQITVAGLLTGQDLKQQLTQVPLGLRLLLPEVMLRQGEEIFLDDVTVDDLENALQTKIGIVQSDGVSFLRSILDEIEVG